MNISYYSIEWEPTVMRPLIGTYFRERYLVSVDSNGHSTYRAEQFVILGASEYEPESNVYHLPFRDLIHRLDVEAPDELAPLLLRPAAMLSAEEQDAVSAWLSTT